jgi:hypothetical protein
MRYRITIEYDCDETDTHAPNAPEQLRALRAGKFDVCDLAELRDELNVTMKCEVV